MGDYNMPESALQVTGLYLGTFSRAAALFLCRSSPGNPGQRPYHPLFLLTFDALFFLSAGFILFIRTNDARNTAAITAAAIGLE